MKIIGHRGARGLAAENTLPAFRKAIEHGVDQLEFDLRVSKDGVVVLNHNPYLTDPAGNKLIVKDTLYTELLRHKPDLLRFEDFLDTIGHTTHLLVEIKPGEPTKAIIAIIKHKLDGGWRTDSFSIGSFDQAILRTMHAAFPDIEMVVIERWSGVRAHFRARQVGTKRLNMRSWWLWRGFLRSMHKRGYQISPYTMNDPAKVQKWQPYLYGVITDRPDLFEK